MKSIVLPILFILLISSLATTIEGQAYCTKEKGNTAGGCGVDPKTQCYIDFLKEFGPQASSQIQPQGLQVPCFFIFGDSLVDNGNNNRILTLARANYRPYGVDFPQGATGRFTNGRTYVDALAQLLGFPNYIPPYARTRGPALLRGVNYASGAAGILDQTGTNLGDHTSMNQQVAAFGETVLQMRRYFRGDNNALNNYLSKCIFYSGMGSNDYLNNYFMPTFYSTSSDYTTKAFAALLLQEYTRQLMVCS
ncbi:GDSL esterase/lipase [Citrus sinensis]|uniref:GDSL esterase/lipase n=1 Tax=Citrus sinensis TaxID=2711 RepID=A0ACB8M7J9_CITSI|nr:GDSL esterase/lipase [Citrus sinensis]KAH9781453.1 GDSL esterase/lipase [Citrus sinensis]